MTPFNRRLLAVVAISGLVASQLAITSQTAAATVPSVNPVTYSYDPAGRLIGADQPGVGSVQYDYDGAGNMTATTPGTSNTPKIFSVTPQHAVAGASVTVTGSGFSATPSSDEVTVGGVASTVTAATASRLTVTVAAGAVTGPVKVTVGGATATGPDFVLDSTNAGPIISGLSASLVNAGDALSISGSGFSTTAALNNVLINQTRATVTSATATTISVTVPASAAASGHVSVSTPNGTVTSSQDVYVLPPVLSGAVVDSQQRISSGSPATMTTTTTTHHGALALFDAVAGQNLVISEGTSTIPGCDGTLTLYDPHNVVVESDGCVSSGDFYDRVALRTPGTYTLALSTSGGSGSATVTPTLIAADSTTAVVPDGTPHTVTTSVGQVANLRFTASAGQQVFVNATSMTDHATGYTAVRILDPSSVVLASTSIGSATGYIDTTTLPSAGTYTVQVDPQGTDTGNATIAIYAVSPNVTAVAADGVAHTVTNTVGQNPELTFTASAGQKVFINATAVTDDAASGYMTLRLLDPTGASVTTSFLSSTTGYIDTATLSTAGTYTLRVDPGGMNTGNASIAIYNVDPNVTAAAADGAPHTVTNVVGQNPELTFTASAGQKVFINATAVTDDAASGYMTLRLLDPTGASVTTSFLSSTTGYIDTATLSTAGTYTLRVDPGGPNTGNATIAIYNVDPNVSTAATDGVAHTVTNAVGQNPDLTFTASAGQKVFINATAVTDDAASGYMTLRLLDPTGASVTTSLVSSTTGYLDTATLAAAGTYTLRVDPGGPNTGNATIAIYNVDPNVTAAAADGVAHTVTNTIGQNPDLTFTATANQRISVSATGVTDDAASGYMTLRLLSPAGASVTTSFVSGSSGSIGTTTLAAAGTYTLRVDPGGPNTGNATIAISTVTTLQAATRQSSELGAAATGPTSGDDLPPKPRRAITSRAPASSGTTGPHASVASAPPAGPSPASLLARLGRDAGRLSARDGWIPTAQNLDGADWLSHRVAAPAASIPPVTATPGTTALAGQVLSVAGTPLAGVRLSIGDRATRSDAVGRFLLSGSDAGQQVLLIDGSPASTPGHRFGIFQVSVTLKSKQTTVLPYTIWLTQLDLAHATPIASPTTTSTVITTPEIPGFEVVLPAGTVVRDLHGHVVRSLSITPVPTDRPPFPLPAGVHTPAYFTVQPGGSYIFPQGARIIYPNSTHAPAGTRVQFYNYDPQGRGWYVYGSGTVTSDGKQVAPDPGVKVWTFTGAMINIPGLLPPALREALANAWRGLVAADPVDPSTGLFTLQQPDLVEQDTIPLTLARAYRQQDSSQYAFGPGFNWTYGIYEWSAHQYQESDLIFPNGSRIHFIRTSPGTSFTDAVFRATDGWGDFANATQVWNGNGWNIRGHNGLTYVFGENQPLQSIRDRYGNQVTISRVGGGQSGDIAQVTSPHGLWIRFSYNSWHEITQAVDNAGRTISYAYDTSHRLVQVTGATGGVTKYTWDSNNNLLTVTDARNNVIVTNTYDASNRVATQQIGTGGSFTFAYTTDSNNHITQTDVTDPDSHVTRYTYNADGAATSRTLAPGTAAAQTTTWTLAPTTGYVTARTDPLGNVTSYTYDSNGDVTSVTAMSGTSQARTTSIDTSGPYGQAVSTTDALGHATTYAYDRTGAVASITDPLGRATSYTYTADGQLASVADNVGNSTSYSYNAFGQVAAITDPMTRVTRRWSDAVNRAVVTTVADGGQTSATYDAGNHVTAVTDPVGGVTQYGYDADGELTAVTDPNGHTTSYTFDANGDPTGWSQQGVGAPSLTNTFDAAGVITSSTDGRGKKTTFSYDSLGRRSAVNFGVSGSTSTSSISYSYDGGNRLTTASDSIDGDTTWAYDAFNEPTTVTDPRGAITYSYDAGGRETGATVHGGTPISYDYDAAGQLTGVTQGTTTVGYSYDADGRLATLSLPGATQSYSYNASSQPTAVSYSHGGTALGDLTYSYDPAGRLATQGGSWARLGLPAAMTASYNASNQATTINGTSQSYDAAGALTNDGTRTYSYDDRGQLSAVTGGGSSQSFGYSATGQRATVTTGGATTGYLWDINGNQVAEVSGASVTATELTGLATDQTLVRTDSTGGLSLLTDRLGSTLATADSDGALHTEFSYTPYGGQSSAGDVNTTAPSYTGRTQDAATGLQYNRDRYYNPSTGRFLAQDPIGQGGGANVYAYTSQDPVNRTDPSGDAQLLMLGMAVAAAILAPELLGLELEVALEAAAEEEIALTAEEAAASEAADGAAEVFPEIKPGASGGETAGKDFPRSVRNEVLEDNPDTCVYCRMKTDSPQVDHSIPKSRGGDATVDNGQTTCGWCNGSKNNGDFPKNPPPGYRGPWPPPWWGLGG